MPRGRPKNPNGATSAAPTKANGNGASLGFEVQLFLTADKLRKNLEPSDYKHVVLGLIFLKHISYLLNASCELTGVRLCVGRLDVTLALGIQSWDDRTS